MEREFPRKRRVPGNSDMLSSDDKAVRHASSGLHHNRIRNNSGDQNRRRPSKPANKVMTNQTGDSLKNQTEGAVIKSLPVSMIGSKLLTSSSQQTVSASQQTAPLETSEVYTPPVKRGKKPKSTDKVVDLPNSKLLSSGHHHTAENLTSSKAKPVMMNSQHHMESHNSQLGRRPLAGTKRKCEVGAGASSQVQRKKTEKVQPTEKRTEKTAKKTSTKKRSKKPWSCRRRKKATPSSSQRQPEQYRAQVEDIEHVFVQRWYAEIEREQAASEAQDNNFDFSPPPSPQSYNKNLLENISNNLLHYVDGGYDSLRTARQHIRWDDDDEAKNYQPKDIDWTRYGFPPNFNPDSPVPHEAHAPTDQMEVLPGTKDGHVSNEGAQVSREEADEQTSPDRAAAAEQCQEMSGKQMQLAHSSTQALAQPVLRQGGNSTVGCDLEPSEPVGEEEDSDEDEEFMKIRAQLELQILQEKVAIDREAEETYQRCQPENTGFGEPCNRTAEDCANMQSGRKRPSFVMCTVCKRCSPDVESVLKHQVKEHPSIQCSYFVVKEGLDLETQLNPEVSSQGIPKTQE